MLFRIYRGKRGEESRDCATQAGTSDLKPCGGCWMSAQSKGSWKVEGSRYKRREERRRRSFFLVDSCVTWVCLYVTKGSVREPPMNTASSVALIVSIDFACFDSLLFSFRKRSFIAIVRLFIVCCTHRSPLSLPSPSSTPHSLSLSLYLPPPPTSTMSSHTNESVLALQHNPPVTKQPERNEGMGVKSYAQGVCTLLLPPPPHDGPSSASSHLHA